MPFFYHEGILPSASLSYMYLGFQESKISIQCTWSRAITGNANKKRICPNRVICLLKCAIRKNFPWRKVALESLTVQQTGKQIDENIKSELMF